MWKKPKIMQLLGALKREGGCNVRQYQFNSLLDVLHDIFSFSMVKTLFKAEHAGLGN